MSDSWRSLPAPARAVAVAASSVVAAARARDNDLFAEAVGDLAVLDPERVSLVLGAAVRLLLEDLHPDGLDGDDVRDALERTVRAAGQWQPEVDPHVVLIVLAGALGVHDRDEEAAPPSAESLARHAALLLAELLGERGRPFADYLTRAFAEIERAQLND
ncbi:MAG TPA: hypothetical protein VK453_16620 [Micromonosporaceae bacterium]|nr:hypothetical protein [Micromonosporaceae bacterium]